MDGVGRQISCCVHQGEQIMKYNFLLEESRSLNKFSLAQMPGAMAAQMRGGDATKTSDDTRSCSQWSTFPARGREHRIIAVGLAQVLAAGW